MADLEAILIRLRKDLKSIGLPEEEVDILFAPRYSKTYYALYYPMADKSTKPHIRLYPYRYKGCSLVYPYTQLLDTSIHEMCHHLQFRNPNYVRYKGVVHDDEFWELYNRHIKRAKTMGLLEEEEDECEDLETFM